jgi:hypothetical protein
MTEPKPSSGEVGVRIAVSVLNPGDTKNAGTGPDRGSRSRGSFRTAMVPASSMGRGKVESEHSRVAKMACRWQRAGIGIGNEPSSPIPSERPSNSSAAPLVTQAPELAANPPFGPPRLRGFR